MIEQWYAVHKKTGEFFCHKGRYCFSEKGVLQSLRNEKGIWISAPGTNGRSYSMRMVVDPLPEWDIRKVELT